METTLQTFLKQWVHLEVPDEQGVVLREHYASIAKMYQQMGRPEFVHPQAQHAPLPPGASYIIELFFQINRNRRFMVAGMGGAISLPLSDGDVLDFLNLYRDELRLWELELMRKLDQTYLKAIEAKKKGDIDP